MTDFNVSGGTPELRAEVQRLADAYAAAVASGIITAENVPRRIDIFIEDMPEEDPEVNGSKRRVGANPPSLFQQGTPLRKSEAPKKLNRKMVGFTHPTVHLAPTGAGGRRGSSMVRIPGCSWRLESGGGAGLVWVDAAVRALGWM